MEYKPKSAPRAVHRLQSVAVPAFTKCVFVVLGVCREFDTEGGGASVGSSFSEKSSSGVDWLSPVVLPGSPGATHHPQNDASHSRTTSSPVSTYVDISPSQPPTTRLPWTSGKSPPHRPPSNHLPQNVTPDSTSCDSSAQSPWSYSSESSTAFFSSMPIQPSTARTLSRQPSQFIAESQQAAPVNNSSTNESSDAAAGSIEITALTTTPIPARPYLLDTTPPALGEKLRSGLSGDPLEDYRNRPIACASHQLPVDLDESAESASPQPPARPLSGDLHDGRGLHEPVGAQRQDLLDRTSTETSAGLLTEAQRLLSTITNADAAATELLAIVNNQLQEPTNLQPLQSALDQFCRKWYPHRWVPKRKKPIAPSRVSNRRQRRRLQYGHIQNLFRRSRKDAASTVLDGRWREAFASVQDRIDGFTPYWKAVLEQPAHQDSRAPREVVPTDESLLRPITTAEITTTLAALKGSSPGLDKVTPAQLQHRNTSSIAAFLNILLAAGKLPDHLNVARITFVPKSPASSEPSEFRPISVTSVFVRLLHKILFNRWVPNFPADRLQFGFLQRDGCFEATTILHAALRHSHTLCRNLSFASLDISKAFDSVSHESILRAAASFGAPPSLCQYLSTYYSEATSVFEGTVVHPQRGVRQGDPLSPLLFIMVMDEALSDTQFFPWSSPAGPLDYLAFADDIVLFAEDRANLEGRLTHLATQLERVGLSINSTKSSCVNIVADGRRKMTMLDDRPITLASSTITSLSPADEFQFLGVPFNWKGKLPTKALKDLDRMLRELRSAPLKPQQRVDILRFHLLPKLDHALILSDVHKNTLRSMDLSVRSAVKQWLRLPKDTSNAFFYASINDGGLGIPHLQTKIPLNRRDRLEKRLNSSHPMTTWALRDPASLTTHRLARYPVFASGTPVTDKASADEAWRQHLHATLDGAPLRDVRTPATSHHWLRDGSRMFPRLYIRAVQLRAGVLPSKSRRARGRPTPAEDLRCRGNCGRRETVSHVLQSCAVTHDARCKRHNDTCRTLLRKLKTRHVQYLCEPHIVTARSFIKPDMIVLRDNKAFVLDVAICDAERMEATVRLKLDKYAVGANGSRIEEFIQSVFPLAKSVVHAPIVFNNRGFIHPQSHRTLLSLNLTKLDISDLCVLEHVGWPRPCNGLRKVTNQNLRSAVSERETTSDCDEDIQDEWPELVLPNFFTSLESSDERDCVAGCMGDEGLCEVCRHRLAQKEPDGAGGTETCGSVSHPGLLPISFETLRFSSVDLESAETDHDRYSYEGGRRGAISKETPTVSVALKGPEPVSLACKSPGNDGPHPSNISNPFEAVLFSYAGLESAETDHDRLSYRGGSCSDSNKAYDAPELGLSICMSQGSLGCVVGSPSDEGNLNEMQMAPLVAANAAGPQSVIATDSPFMRLPALDRGERTTAVFDDGSPNRMFTIVDLDTILNSGGLLEPRMYQPGAMNVKPESAFGCSSAVPVVDNEGACQFSDLASVTRDAELLCPITAGLAAGFGADVSSSGGVEATSVTRDAQTQLAVVAGLAVVETQQGLIRSSMASFECFCGREFASNRGLGQHKRHRHPVELNAERLHTWGVKRTVWTDQELGALVRLASKLAPKFRSRRALSVALCKYFVGRSYQAIMKRLTLLRWVNPMGDWEEDDGEEVEMSTGGGHADCVLTQSIDENVLNDMLAGTWPAAPVEDLSSAEVVGQLEPLLLDSMPVGPEPGTVVQVSGHTNDGNSLSVGASELQSVSDRGVDKADGRCLTRLEARTVCCSVRTRSAREKSWKSWSYRDRKRLVGLARRFGSRCETRGVLADTIRRYFPGRSTAALLQELRRVETRGVRVPLRSLVLAQPDLCENVDSGSMNETNREVWVGDMLSSILTDLRSAVGSCLGKAELEKLVLGLLEGSVSLSQLPERLACHAVEIFPRVTVRERRERTRQKRGKMVSGKLRRRLAYAALQKLYAKRRRDAAKVVIEGTWDELSCGGQELPVGTLEYWKSVLSREGQSDSRRPLSGESLAALVEPITIDETRWALRAMRNDTAPGLDGLTTLDIKSYPIGVFTGYLNLLYLSASPPAHLLEARIKLLPKCVKPMKPSDFRPIAIASVIVRCLHKVIARRWSSRLKLATLQVAFLQRDGCLEASSVLHGVLRDAIQRTRGLAAVFLDVSKAFDSVSHETILRNAESYGAPPHLLKYLGNTYQVSRALIGTDFVTCKRGVRQGDPLSPLLFIMAMDEVLRGALPELGYSIGSCVVDAIAYADDLVLFAENPARLQEKLLVAQQLLARAGMTINTQKSISLHLAASAKAKQLVLVPSGFQLNGVTLPVMGPTHRVRYLGLDFTWKGKVSDGSVQFVTEALDRLIKAPLKPQQRREVLITFLLPRLTHRLVLGPVKRGALRKIDKLVRAAYRSWARLPADSNNAFMYTPVKFGGLGLPCLAVQIPLLQRIRFARMMEVDHPVIRSVCEQPSFRRVVHALNHPVCIGSTVVSSKTEAAAAWFDRWRVSADGADAPEVELTSESYSWLHNPGDMFPRVYLRCGYVTRLRHGVVVTSGKVALLSEKLRAWAFVETSRVQMLVVANIQVRILKAEVEKRPMGTAMRVFLRAATHSLRSLIPETAQDSSHDPSISRKQSLRTFLPRCQIHRIHRTPHVKIFANAGSTTDRNLQTARGTDLAPTQRVSEGVHSRADTPDIGFVVESTPPLSPLNDGRQNRTPTESTTTDRSTPTICTPKGRDYSDQSFSVVDWLSLILLHGNITTPLAADASCVRPPAHPPLQQWPLWTLTSPCLPPHACHWI
ncbi:uncharacterized protein DEA37_0011154 [Paragonimus westermani]|uniref:Reverse transcriptase domain-containing protein n=1 Tax=Paragonimus westermani TaxID=34504 RepID=A0A5J4NCA6_9TREM|nr:uncharacterized protein DEA37_0011154 [Paragonimus westermani]